MNKLAAFNSLIWKGNALVLMALFLCIPTSAQTEPALPGMEKVQRSFRIGANGRLDRGRDASMVDNANKVVKEPFFPRPARFSR
jgi:hypothetical protein